MQAPQDATPVPSVRSSSLPFPQVNQGNMPGIQSTFLAMDTEEGVEVVWNELLFTDKKAFKAHEEKIKTMFEQLVLVDHPNIVKLHKYWLDVKDLKARVIFITEYVSSGSLKQFLKKTKKNHKAMNARAWKRWCTQILSALSFLHSCEPPIIHGNLTSDTIFIQHNGLIKIGSVWHRVFANALPDDLRSPIRIEREELRNLHFFPPEYGQKADGTAVDIFSFGMCALEMAVLEIQTNGDTRVSEEAIARARHSLDDPNMREFILSCLTLNPDKRPTAHNLLFHRVLFEVHSLKLLAAHCFINHQYLMPENVVEEKIKELDLNMVMAEIRREGRPGAQWRYSEVSFLELDKFLEDVRWVGAPSSAPSSASAPQGMWSQDGHRGLSVLSPAVLGASSLWCPQARGAAHPCSFQSQLCQGHRGWNQLCVLPLCLCQEWDLPPDELRCLQTPRPPTCLVPAPGGSSESQDSHARAL
uniref:Nuclear receptor binding protein 2 n=1 Tax=Corvus moneduloides TaxID=1196302 RepID=A0A8C3H3U2_CORMO